jgi:hypothetical protein
MDISEFQFQVCGKSQVKTQEAWSTSEYRHTRVEAIEKRDGSQGIKGENRVRKAIKLMYNIAEFGNH